jgi:DNA excision repair protein ERCC-4
VLGRALGPDLGAPVIEPLIRVAIDRREQLPYSFNNSVFEMVPSTLKSGDYSLVGFEDRYTLERKSLSDLLGSLTQGRERFIREMLRVRTYEFSALILECTWSDILVGNWPLLHGRPCSRVHPASIRGTLIAFSTRYTQVCYAGDRLGGQQMASDILRRLWLDARADSASRSERRAAT